MNGRLVVPCRHWPLLAALFTLWLATSLLLIRSINQNDGHLVYALDDTYIHMAIAKHLVENGVWGINRYGFSSSASSLIWPLLLSLSYGVLGVRDAIPFVLNILLATLALCVIYAVLRRYNVGSVFSFIVLLFIVFSTPMPTLILIGMEHILYLLLVVGFLYFSTLSLCEKSGSGGAGLSLNDKLVLLMSQFVTATRYEGVFLVLVVCVLYGLRRRFLHSLVLAVLAALPLAIYALISFLNGWYVLPNSVIAKGNRPGFGSLNSLINSSIDFVYQQMMDQRHIFILFTLSLILFYSLYRKNRVFWQASPVMIVIFAATAVLHMQFAGAGGFYRYESYLGAIGLLVFSIALWEWLGGNVPVSVRRWPITLAAAVALGILLLAFPFIRRGALSFIRTPPAIANIYQQQYQMGLFLREYYQGAGVAANDIGAINYLADIRSLDLWGLGARETSGPSSRSPEHLDALSNERNVKVAIVYDRWFEPSGGLPPTWTRVGRWKISQRTAVAEDTVSFYAVDPSEEKALIEHLKGFSSRLPAGVVQGGEYSRRVAEGR